MSDVDAGFLEVLASCAGADGEVDYSDTGWMPPDGDYTVHLERFSSGTKEKNGVQNGWAKVILRVMTTEFQGRAFGEFFWLPSHAQKANIGMCNLLRLATCISDRELAVAEIQEAGQIVADAAGNTFLNVRIRTTTKDGKTYTNTMFTELVGDDAAEAEAEARPATA